MSENVQTKDLPKVIAELEKKCEELPDNVVAHHHLAVVYKMAGRPDDALRMLERCLEIDPQAVVVFITAYGDAEKAVKSIKMGATDFILKPWDSFLRFWP